MSHLEMVYLGQYRAFVGDDLDLEAASDELEKNARVAFFPADNTSDAVALALSGTQVVWRLLVLPSCPDYAKSNFS
jgi:hypothetical protein